MKKLNNFMQKTKQKNKPGVEFENKKPTKSEIKSALDVSMDRYFTDEFYGNQLGRLFKAGKLDTIKLPRDISEEQIQEMRDTLKQFDYGYLGIQSTSQGKVMLIIIPDGQVIAKALDMVAKLKGWYAPDKIEVSQPATITGMRIIDISQKKLEDLKLLEEMKQDMIDDDNTYNDNNDGRADFDQYAREGFEKKDMEQ